MRKNKSTQKALARSATAPRFKPDYTYAQLEKLTERELKREYSKVRSVLRKRIERIEQSGFGFVPDMEGVKRNLLPVKEVVRKQEGIDPGAINRNWATRINSMYQALGKKTFTVSGARAYYRQALEFSGYIDQGERINMDDLNKFFSLWHTEGLDGLYGSETVIDQFRELSSGKTENLSELQKRWLEFNRPMKRPQARGKSNGAKLKAMG